MRAAVTAAICRILLVVPLGVDDCCNPHCKIEWKLYMLALLAGVSASCINQHI